MLENWYYDRRNQHVGEHEFLGISFIYFTFGEVEYKLATGRGVCIGQVNVITADCIRKHRVCPHRTNKNTIQKNKQFEALTFSISDSMNVIFLPRLMRYSGGK